MHTNRRVRLLLILHRVVVASKVELLRWVQHSVVHTAVVRCARVLHNAHPTANQRRTDITILVKENVFGPGLAEL